MKLIDLYEVLPITRLFKLIFFIVFVLRIVQFSDIVNRLVGDP